MNSAGECGYAVCVMQCMRNYVPMLNVTMTFSREAILDDIKNLAYVEADLLGAENEHGSHMVADIGEDGNVERTVSVIDLLMAKCGELLYGYTKEDITGGEERNNDYSDEERYTFKMLMPKTMSKTTLNYMAKLIHEWVVNGVLANWLSITYPEGAAKWAGASGELEAELRKCLNRRTRPTVRKLSPF